MKLGDKVKFTGSTSEQVKWGNNDDPTGKLISGHTYIISNIEEHSWHTKVSLQGIEGQFNSGCFRVVQ